MKNARIDRVKARKGHGIQQAPQTMNGMGGYTWSPLITYQSKLVDPSQPIHALLDRPNLDIMTLIDLLEVRVRLVLAPAVRRNDL
jgi:hypothetical protein